MCDKKSCQEPLNIPINNDVEMKDICTSLSSCIIIDDYTVDELNSLFPLWMQPSLVDLDSLLYKSSD